MKFKTRIPKGSNGYAYVKLNDEEICTCYAHGKARAELIALALNRYFETLSPEERKKHIKKYGLS